MSNFLNTVSPTPFGLFDNQLLFQKDADKVNMFILRKLGSDVLSVELTKKMIWTCFEEATLMLNGILIEYQAKSNLGSLLGNPTGSVDASTGRYTLNLLNNYVQPNFEFLIRQAEPYAAEVGYGQSLDSYSGSITLATGKQDYDLYADLKDSDGIPLANYMGTGSLDMQGKMKIFEVYHFAPVQYVFNSNLASNFIASGLPVESYVPDTRFYVLPLYEDVLRAGMLKAAQKVRRSNYSYRITGRNIRIYPSPNNLIPNFNDKLWIRVGFPPSAVPGIMGTYFSGSVEASGSYQNIPFGNSYLYGASNPANIPAGLLNYDSLNPWARNWIFQMTLALAKEVVGLVRNKIKTIPIPSGDTLTLNGDDLIQQAREDKQNLLTGETGILTRLDGLTYDKLAEMEANRAENLQKLLQKLAVPPSYNIVVK